MTAPAGGGGLARRLGTGDAVLIGVGSGWAPRLLAVAAILGVAGLNYRGITKTALLTRVLVAATLLALAVVVLAIGIGGQAGSDRLGGWAALGTLGPYGVLQSAGLIGFSSFGVLMYYAIAIAIAIAIADAAAFTQPATDCRWPRGLNVLGALGCLTLVATLPPAAVIAGMLMFTGGLAGRLVILRLCHRGPQPISEVER